MMIYIILLGLSLTSLYMVKAQNCNAAVSDNYIVVVEAMTATDGEAYCQSEFNSNLASIHNTAQNDDAYDLCASLTSDCWIGLNDRNNERGSDSSGWEWTDGSSYDFMQWGTGEPNNADNGLADGEDEDCVHHNFYGNAWNDEPCSFQYPLLCNQPTPPITTLCNVIVTTTSSPTSSSPTSSSITSSSPTSSSTTSSSTTSPSTTSSSTTSSSTTSSSPTSSSTTSSDSPAWFTSNNPNIALYVIIGLIVLGCIAVLICIKCCCCKKKRRKDDNKRSIEGDSNNTKNPNPDTSIEIKYVDQNGNPISPPMTQSNSNIKYVDQNGNPVSAPMRQSTSNIKYVDQNGNPVSPQVAPPVVQAITNIKYVDQNGNPISAPPVQSNIKYVDQNGNPISAPPSNINYT